MELTGSSALVTGAASGLGAATAAALAGAGAAVVGLDLAVAWDRAPAPPAGVIALPGDVTAPEQVQTAVERAGRDGPLRVAVNCAGLGTAGRILSRSGVHELDMFARVIQVNLVGTFNVLRLAAAAMADTDPLDADGQRGLIVNTASVAAFDGQIGQAAYASSKGGVVGLTLPAARDLAQYGIRVVTIAPGIIDTPMLAGITPEFRATLSAGVPHPSRLGRPDEYAQLVLAIAGLDYLNGEVIRLDGALRMPPR
ncbi:SDR family NAD(P)-dependent oxidoreductase [Nakamurella multipartita]|jgi:NAD(P)-dependent dehydrogenase (short-subunit alcohol dehydrogenase family)|uniref:Short-chain dehydrogenase/reductase SDR n=1 Tax=Nakamurella multipartita (strain ATCC 700099 / DSM 44233 / CIP 104796 / JCM 9543 / NBRC 105858 / Y-104) TaxID=479431 RepID=C8XJU9_NAKMY|nr:SDR family NAD(P)-dependent oxidoreductase [Nakamurella multipartita]ACV76632.1 short-chain dehydrogenase/reductase SDR [Nakamurella multipartita DSM 44233]HOZ56831.1 SDR family NAD(P)-dependent oxidoreductase [Nakamurella multipartita]